MRQRFRSPGCSDAETRVASTNVSRMMRSMDKFATYPVMLTSRRLLLRPLNITDAAGLARMTNDPLVTRNLLKTAMPFTTADARELILRARRKKSPVWAIDTGQLVGLIGLAGEFGYWLGRTLGAKALPLRRHVLSSTMLSSALRSTRFMPARSRTTKHLAICWRSWGLKGTASPEPFALSVARWCPLSVTSLSG